MVRTFITHMLIRKSESIIINRVTRTKRGLKQTWVKAIKKDIIMVYVTEKMPLKIDEWKKRIHVASLKIWHQGFVVVVANQKMWQNKLNPSCMSKLIKVFYMLHYADIQPRS